MAAPMKEVAATAKPPDGGWGWVVVACSFFIHVVIDGLTFSFGVLAVEFVDDLGSTRLLNGWIIAVLVGTILGTGPIVSAMCAKYGNRTILIAGAVLGWAGLSVSYFVIQPEMLILTVSLITGFGIGMIYLPAIVCVGIYFEKRRSTAIGIAVSGAGLGIFLYSPFINYLIDEYTWRGAVLILSGTVLNCAVFGCFMKPLPAAAATADPEAAEEAQPLAEEEARTPDKLLRCQQAAGYFLSLQDLSRQKQQRRHRTRSVGDVIDSAAVDTAQPPPLKLLASRSAFAMASAMSLTAGGLKPSPTVTSAATSGGKLRRRLTTVCHRVASGLNLAHFRNPVFLVIVASNLLFNMGFDAPILFAPDRAQQSGYSPSKASFLVSAIGIGNLVGRLTFGFLSDIRGVNKTLLYAASLTTAGVALFASLISNAYPFMIFYCIVFGNFVGSYITLTPAVLADLLGADQLNDTFGLTLLFQAIGVLIGAPMAGAIFDHTKSFDLSYIASGSCMLLSGIILFPVPCLFRWQAARQREAPDANNLCPSNP